MSPRKTPAAHAAEDEKVSFYLAWCKRCGNCVAFCPRQALAADEWGHPVLIKPERCTSCRLCEMLCPDFAIRVGETYEPVSSIKPVPEPGSPEVPIAPQSSPERVAPELEEDNGG
ncbi:MAG: 4Fe-4S binding protein [Desulfarculaceae bacterium]